MQFEICCIPFFIYDVALGDVVETDNLYVMTKVLRPSGRFVFRVWFRRGMGSRTELLDDLIAMGCLLEWSSKDFLAVDAPNETIAQSVADRLEAAELDGLAEYETGRSA